MGLRFFDQFSVLHFAVGVLAYFWSVSFLITMVIHILFEFIENTPLGMNLINTYFSEIWPGGKTHPDNLLNRTSDTLFTGLGWGLSWWLDRIYGR
jgi:hypothetical protein